MQNEQKKTKEDNQKRKKSKKDKKSKKAKKSHKHKKKHDKSKSDKEDATYGNGTHKKRDYDKYNSIGTSQDKDRDLRDRHHRDSREDSREYRGSKQRYESYRNHEADEREYTDKMRNREKDKAKSRDKEKKEQEKERRRQQKSAELLEDKRKSRPMSPPKEFIPRDRRRHVYEDTHSWRPSNYTPPESSSLPHPLPRVAPPPPEDWDRRLSNGYREVGRSRSPGYEDRRQDDC